MVGGHAVPEDPQLRTASERAVWAALRAQLNPDEILLASVRFSDPRNGDVEADFIVLMPDLGAAVVEVKGGEVRYADGEWVTANGDYARRIHPVEQARRAKHALRRYLDRQPEWHGPLLRTEWLLAVPMMEVEGDLGPEARRDLLIDRSDLPTIMDRVRAAVGDAASRDPLPQGDWAETALTLLLRQVDDGPGYEREVRPAARGWRRWAGLSAIALAQDPELSSYSGHVEDSGEGRWTLLAAIEEAVPAEVLSAALYTRFRSRQDHTFAEKTLSAMRKQFGGHQEPKKPV